MAVITVSREAGTGGTQIAKEVAQALGYHYADKNDGIAVMKEFGFSRYEEEYDSKSGLRFDLVRSPQERSEKKAMVDLLPKISLALAYHGNMVMLGRGSYSVLGGRADVLNVRVQAPFGKRVECLMERNGIERGEAQTLVRERDEVRTEFVREWYGAKVDDTSLFDLVIDTSKIPPDVAVRWVVEAAQLLENRKRSPNERTSENIEVDPALVTVVNKRIGCELIHR